MTAPSKTVKTRISKHGRGKKKKKRVLSFKGFIKEIREDSIILKGRYMWDGWIRNKGLGNYRAFDLNGQPPWFIKHKKIARKDIMRIVDCDPNEIKIFEK